MPKVRVNSQASEMVDELVGKLTSSDYRPSMRGWPRVTQKEADRMVVHAMDKAVKKKMRMTYSHGMWG